MFTKASVKAMGQSCFALLQCDVEPASYGDGLIGVKKQVYLLPSQNPAPTTSWWVYQQERGLLQRFVEVFRSSSSKGPRATPTQQALWATNTQLVAVVKELEMIIPNFNTYIVQGRTDYQPGLAREGIRLLGKWFLYPFLTKEHGIALTLQQRVDKVVAFLKEGSQGETIQANRLLTTIRLVTKYYDLVAFEDNYDRYLPIRQINMLTSAVPLQGADQEALTQFVQNIISSAGKPLGLRPFDSQRFRQIIDLVYHKTHKEPQFRERTQLYKGLRDVFAQQGQVATEFFDTPSAELQEEIAHLIRQGSIDYPGHPPLTLSDEFPGAAEGLNRHRVFSCGNNLHAVVMFPKTNIGLFLYEMDLWANAQHHGQEGFHVLQPLYIDTEGRYAIFPRLGERLSDCFIPQHTQVLTVQQNRRIEALQGLLKVLSSSPLSFEGLSADKLHFQPDGEYGYQLVVAKALRTRPLREGESNYLAVEGFIQTFFPFHDIPYRSLAITFSISGQQAIKELASLFTEALEIALLSPESHEEKINALCIQLGEDARARAIAQKSQAEAFLEQYLLILRDSYEVDLVEAGALRRAIALEIIAFHKIDGGGVRLMPHKQVPQQVAIKMGLRFKGNTLDNKLTALQELFLIQRTSAVETLQYSPLIQGFLNWRDGLQFIDDFLPQCYPYGITNTEDARYLLEQLQAVDRQQETPLLSQYGDGAMPPTLLYPPVAEESLGIREGANLSNIYMIESNSSIEELTS